MTGERSLTCWNTAKKKRKVGKSLPYQYKVVSLQRFKIYMIWQRLRK
jgi:hypothetical protein